MMEEKIGWGLLQGGFSRALVEEASEKAMYGFATAKYGEVPRPV